MIDNLVTIVVALCYPLMLIGGICVGILAFRTWLDWGRPIHGPAVMWPLPAVDAPDAEFEAWLQGYEFALRNLHDEAVQADLANLTAGVNAGMGDNSNPPNGADDAPNKAKGAAPTAPAPAVTLGGYVNAFREVAS